MPDFTITLYRTDGEKFTALWDTHDAEYSLGGVTLRVYAVGCGEYALDFTPSSPLTLSRLTLTAVLPTRGLMYYDNGECTNVFTRIVKGEGARFQSRDVLLCRADDYRFNIAFSTFDTFFTRFSVRENELEVIYYLEDKTVRKGEVYHLERLYMNSEPDAQAFFEDYTSLLKKNYNIGNVKPPVCGWSSWSCVYSQVTEQIVMTQARELNELSPRANLIQIDDGWQINGSFGGYWTEDAEKFPSGMPYINSELKKLGVSLGLWVAPGMLSKSSPLYEEFKDRLYAPEAEARVSFSDVVPLDIGEESVLEYTRNIFSRLKNEYGCIYFKIDFLTNLLYRAGVDGSPVVYRGDYSVKLYRNFIKSIREAVGDDVFLLSCGAPVGEGLGIFDGMRVSADVTWGGASKPGHPGAWNIIKNDIQCMILRSAYRSVYITDPDALLVRDYLSDADDGLVLSYDEARITTAAAALSGGHILINEELQKLPYERLELIKRAIPPLGRAARPADFFEYPRSTVTYLQLDKTRRVYAVYNFEDEPCEKKLDFPFLSDPRLYDCFTGESLPLTDTFELPPRSCRVLLLSDGETPATDDLFFRHNT